MKKMDKISREKEQKQSILKWASSSSNSLNTKNNDEPISVQLKKIVTRELSKITPSN